MTRQILADLRVMVQRYAIAQNLYIASLCFVYLLHNIWAARTLFYYATVPLALLGIDTPLLRSIIKSPIFILSCAYLTLLALTSLTTSDDPDPKIIGNHILQSVRILLFLIITAELTRKDSSFLKTFALFISASAASGAVFNMVAYYASQEAFTVNLTRQLQGVPDVATYYNSNVIGAIYSVACIFGASLLSTPGRSLIETHVSLISSSILMIAVVLTQSRGSILALTIGLTAIALLTISRRRLQWVALGAIVVFITLCLATPLVGNMIERGAAFRPAIWWFHLQLALQSPLLGHGLSFDTSMKLPDGSVLASSHNIVLSAFVRGGVLAAGALLGLIVVCLYQSWLQWRSTGVVLPFALMITATVATAFDYDLAASSLGWPWLLFWLPVGICLAAGLRLLNSPAATN